MKQWQGNFKKPLECPTLNWYVKRIQPPYPEHIFMSLPTKALALLLCGVASSAVAAENPAKTAYLIPYVGWFDLIDKGNEAMQIGLEYRFKPVWQGLRPMLGANLTDDSSLYTYAGLNYDFVIGNRFYITPNFAAGAYHKSNGKNLGGLLEFRSGLEFGYGFNDASRVSAAFNHISNASIYNKNPGAEAVLISYHIPW